MTANELSRYYFIRYMIFYSIFAAIQIVFWILTYNNIYVIPAEVLHSPTIALVVLGVITCLEIALSDVTVDIKALIKAKKEGKK